MKRILTGLAGLIGLAVIGLGIWTWSPLPKNPDATTLSAAAANYDAEIIRDEWGVPHIHGVRDADASFGLGYAHAEDDFDTIQLSIAAARGVLARYKGKDAAPTDYLVSLLGVWDTIDRKYESHVTPETKAIAEAYVAGLNLYAAENPDATWRGLAPFTAEDVIAGFIFKTPFFYGFDETLLSLFGDERMQEIALDPAGGREAYIIGEKSLATRGSNAFAVAPSRSTDGKTRLFINSHQPFTGPVAWYEAHLMSDEGMDMAGGLFPGGPLVFTGFNRDLGWGNTVSKPDLADVYVLTRNPENEDQYRLDGEWVDFERTTAEMRIKLFGPFALKVRRPVLRSRHGPVVEAKHGTYALRYAGQDEIRQLEEYYRLGKSRTREEFEAALGMLALPSINYVYADRLGNIGYIHNGQFPDRAPGWDWQKYLPGDRSDLIWQDYLPYSAVPKLFNPPTGFLYNSNNDPLTATAGPGNLTADMFPASMGLQTNQTNRALRIPEIIDASTPISEADLLALKFDKSYSVNSDAARAVAAILAEDWSGEPELADAVAHLAAWDFSTDMNSRHAALGVLSTVEAVTARLTHIEPPAPADAFRSAVKLLNDKHGRIDPEWGEVNRLVRGVLDLPIGGGPDILRAIYPAEIREDGTIHAAAGDTYIALVEWDEDGQLSAQVVHQFGSATLDETSPHYADQAPLFAEERFRPMLMDMEDILEHAEERYRPGERQP